MRFTFIGAGAVGGYYGALLARAGHEVQFVARGAHREAIAAQGLQIRSEAVGNFTAKVPAESDPALLAPADLVVLAVKTYDNPSAVPLIPRLVRAGGAVLTLQNGVDSAEAIAAVAGEGSTLAGATYVATAIEEPGVIKQTGTHRRIVFGEYFGDRARVSERVAQIASLLRGADIHAEPVADARHAIWEKFTYLAPFAAFTGAARLPIGALWIDEDCRTAFLAAVQEVRQVAEAHGAVFPEHHAAIVREYLDKLPSSTRSSLLIDLSQGKRIEVEALQGSVVRRGRATGVPTPVMAALYAVLKPWAGGQ